MTTPATDPIKAPNTSTVDGVTVTENDKYKGTLAVEAFDGLLKSINTEAESTTEQAIDITFSAIGAVASTVAFGADPFAQIIGSTVGWLIEHVDPLRELLDKITGDPDQVMRNSEDTKMHAAELRVVAEDHRQLMASYENWDGQASDAFRETMTHLGVELNKMAEATEMKAKIVAIAGLIVTVGRDIIRDMIAEFIDGLIAWAIKALAAVSFSAGLALPFVIGDAIVKIASFVGKVASKVAKIVSALVKLARMIPQLDEALKMLSKA